jgi:hypothetical protein
MRREFRYAVSLLTACSGCGSPSQPAASGKLAGVAACEYAVQVAPAKPLRLEVGVDCDGPELSAFVASEASIAAYVHDARTRGGRALAQSGARFALSEPSTRVALQYGLDLEALAADMQNFDVALRVGDSIISPASTWLLSPSPMPVGVRVGLRIAAPEGTRFASGLRSVGPEYQLEAQEIPVASYGVFGQFALRSLALRGTHDDAASVDLAILDGRLGVDQTTLATWVSDCAGAVQDFFGGFPVDRAFVALVPVPGRAGVPFGKVLPESGPGIVVLVGEHARRKQLYGDWVLVHELFHLGFPSFAGEGKWLDEGLATYYEPIIRARAGFISERDVWEEFSRAMPQGLVALEREGLETASSFGSLYWGGALAVLLADVEARKRSGGARGFEHALRALVAAGANASEVWSLEQTIASIDTALGAPVLVELARRHARSTAHVDLSGLLTKLGVVRRGKRVTLDDGAELAALRRAIVWGNLRAKT